MNGYERIAAVLQGCWPDRVPVMLHNFMLAARQAGYTMKDYRADPRRIADSFIRTVEIYDVDAVAPMPSWTTCCTPARTAWNWTIKPTCATPTIE